MGGVVVLVVGLVGLLVLRWVRPQWEELPVIAVDASSDAEVLSVTIAHNDCGREPEIRVSGETAETVVVQARHDVRGDCDDVGLQTTAALALGAPLGERSIELSDDLPAASCVVDGAPSTRCRPSEP